MNPLRKLLQPFITRRVKREQAKRKRLGMAYTPNLKLKFLRIHMDRVNPDRTLTR